MYSEESAPRAHEVSTARVFKSSKWKESRSGGGSTARVSKPSNRLVLVHGAQEGIVHGVHHSQTVRNPTARAEDTSSWLVYWALGSGSACSRVGILSCTRIINKWFRRYARHNDVEGFMTEIYASTTQSSINSHHPFSNSKILRLRAFFSPH